MITKKGLDFKNLGIFQANSNFSPFLAKIKFFAIFCDFFKFCRFLTLNTEKTVVDEPQVLILYERGCLNLSFPGSNLFVRKIFVKLLNFENMSKNLYWLGIKLLRSPMRTDIVRNIQLGKRRLRYLIFSGRNEINCIF